MGTPGREDFPDQGVRLDFLRDWGGRTGTLLKGNNEGGRVHFSRRGNNLRKKEGMGKKMVKTEIGGAEGHGGVGKEAWHFFDDFITENRATAFALHAVEHKGTLKEVE